MGWQSIRTVGASACVIFILHQKIQKMAKCTFWYWLIQVVPHSLDSHKMVVVAINLLSCPEYIGELHKGSSAFSIRSLVVDKEGTRLGHWLET